MKNQSSTESDNGHFATLAGTDQKESDRCLAYWLANPGYFGDLCPVREPEGWMLTVGSEDCLDLEYFSTEDVADAAVARALIAHEQIKRECKSGRRVSTREVAGDGRTDYRVKSGTK